MSEVLYQPAALSPEPHHVNLTASNIYASPPVPTLTSSPPHAALNQSMLQPYPALSPPVTPAFPGGTSHQVYHTTSSPGLVQSQYGGSTLVPTQYAGAGGPVASYGGVSYGGVTYTGASSGLSPGVTYGGVSYGGLQPGLQQHSPGLAASGLLGARGGVSVSPQTTSPLAPNAPMVTSGSTGRIVPTDQPYAFTTVTYAKPPPQAGNKTHEEFKRHYVQNSRKAVKEVQARQLPPRRKAGLCDNICY